MNIWLDDIRNPVAFGRLGYKWVKTAQEVIDYLKNGQVDKLSLDHDLGACDDCMRPYNGDPEEWLTWHGGMAMPNCEHIGTGYDVVLWLEQNPDKWPAIKPQVHSANPVGRARMQRVIDLHYAKANQ